MSSPSSAAATTATSGSGPLNGQEAACEPRPPHLGAEIEHVNSTADDNSSHALAEDWGGAFLGAKTQRATITVVLLFAAVLLLIGPGRYCWLDHGRAELADMYRHQSHGSLPGEEGDCHTCLVTPGSHHNRPALQVGRNYLSETVSGGFHGLFMTVAIVLGAIGADIPGQGIFAMGSASLAAYGFSVGFGTFLVESAKEEFAMRQLQEERDEVRSMPEAEIAEMTCHYRKRGLSEEDAQQVAKLLSKYEDFWVQHMMSEELGIQLPRGEAAAVSAGIATGASALFFGALPLLGLASTVGLSHWRGPQWYRPQFSTYISLAVSATAVSLLGVFISHAAGSRTPFVNGMLMLINGCGASLLAFSLSQACTWLCQRSNIFLARTPSGSLTSPSQLSMQPGGGDAHPWSAAPTSTAQMTATCRPKALAWPSFRDMFLRALCALWVAASTVIVGMQLLERMAYESLRVFLYGWLTCITTGLGAVPFMFVSADALGERPLAVANAVAGGMMLAASASMLTEAHEHCGPKDWQILVGLFVGVVFIRASERLHPGEGEGEDSDVVALHCAFVERRHFRKAMLIFIVMFFHSAAEGIAVGVAFSRQLKSQFGLYVSLLLAVHNVPEGLAVALVLVPRGVSAPLAALIAILTSVPQPLLAVA
eukprot:CAMPEP_0115306682 /NCGR_PEP_ID=MMETSP0270-20121206/72721_1 /TAXON_ID=71861 /ORGANISM="Scrippsiella trochoidea, Strain CCMP3099" /LENGTH=651 /DNA_ID=CAMNT_0002725041 /DNA_START=23 /DNA_END=1974 /DNA_ORIENTATION=-